MNRILFTALVAAISLVSMPSWVEAQVVAQVNGRNITEKDFENWVRKSFRIGFRGKILQRQDIKKQILENYCHEMALIQYSKRMGVRVTNDEVEAEVNRMKEEFKKRVGDEIPFDRLLMERKITLSGLRHRIRVSQYVRKAVKKGMNEERLKAYFRKYKRHFGGERIRCRHILVLTVDKKTMKPYPDYMKKKAYEKIRKVYDKLTKEKADFVAMVKEYSESPDAESGGDVKWFARKGRMVEPFAAAAYKLKKGEISRIIETEFGFHIIQCIDRKKPRPVGYEEVEEAVKAAFFRDAVQGFTQVVKKKSQINIRIK